MAWKLGVLRMNEDASPQRPVKVSLVLPAHNEAERLEVAVVRVDEALREYGGSYEIVIAEDGSTDGTDKKALMLSERFPNVRYIHSEKRLGRGKALKNAFKNSSGEILVYMDVDLATDLRHLKTLIDSVAVEGYDFATGSRLLAESKVKRSGTRYIASKIYNFMVRAVLGSDVKDHQCGFKAFRRESLLRLLDEVGASHWFWDTELLVRAHRRGYSIKEIPVDWKSGRETKVQLFKDSVNMGWQIFSLWWHLKVQQRHISSFSQENKRSGYQR
jgi:glycosyltransferase involved in cell wall biosynthesis